MLNHSFLKIILSFGLSIIVLSGCSYQNILTNDEKDPLEEINRNFYAFNDNLDKILVEPTAVGYDFVTPNAFQTGVNNFFDNFQYPITISNQLLQGNIKLASQDTLRLIINSTIGLAGLFDPAKNMGFTKHDEDFGQTLAVWGVGEGPYLMLPFLGPYSLRDLTGNVVDYIFDPWIYVDGTNRKIKLKAIEGLQDRADLSTIEHELDNSYDPYKYIKDSYFQNRSYKINNGLSLEEDEEDLIEFDDF